MNKYEINDDVPKVPTRTHLKTSLNNRINAQNLQQTKVLSITSDKSSLENAADMAAQRALGTAKLGSIPSLNTQQNLDIDQFRNFSVSSTGSGDMHKLSEPTSNSQPVQIITSSATRSKQLQNIIPRLIEGEKIVTLNEFCNETSTDIIFVLPDNRGVNGKLCLTNFRLYFRSDEYYNNVLRGTSHYLVIDLPLGLVHRIEKIGHLSSKQNNFYGIFIYCKNGRKLNFAISVRNKQDKSRKVIYDLLHKYAFPLSYNMNFFAFSYKQRFPDETGWFVYDCKKEYERIGVTTKTNDWRFSAVNQDFKLCDTYPKILVVPAGVKDEELKQVAEFRSKHRIPVLSWIKFDNRKNHVALLRSSQPLCGITLKRSEKDEIYLFKIFKLNTINSLDKLYIMDARPVVNAYANRTTGGGHESEDNYKECEINFLNIHNIHVMRESLRKVFDMSLPNVNQYALNQSIISSNTMSASNSSGQSQNQASSKIETDDDKNFLLNLENSKWLNHIRSVLNGALKVVKYINSYSSSVLIHCSDGWDRTAQLTSLSMLMMDKYYRTLKGFEVLIEKEWLSFGHRFGVRMGHGSSDHANQDRSPIFLQFIDCVWQLMQQNTKVFEFNEKLLITIVNNMYTCQFGTFLHNNEFEREKCDVRNKTVSLWSYINSFKNEFKNSSYIEYDGVVECSTSMSSLQLWTAYYFQYKEVIDDSSLVDLPNEINESQKQANNQVKMTNYNMNAPISSKLFGSQSFFHQVVSQMKASVRSYNSPQSNGTIQSGMAQDSELIRYKAVSAHESAD